MNVSCGSEPIRMSLLNNQCIKTFCQSEEAKICKDTKCDVIS